MKTLKVLIPVKKKYFSRANILIQNRYITLNKEAFFVFENIFMTSICQDSEIVKEWDVIAS